MQKLISVFTVALLLVSCLRDETSWNTEVLTPLVKSRLSVENLLNEDQIVANPDSTLKLVYSSDLFSMNTDSFVELPDSSFEFGASLESLDLPNDTVEYTITLGEIIRNSDDPLISAIGAFHGSPSPIGVNRNIALNDQSFDLSMSDLFDELVLDTGNAVIIIDNNFPYAINNLVFNLSNAPQPGGDLIVSSSFTSIPPNSSATRNLPLDDVTILSDLVAEITTLDLNVNIPIFSIIDTNQSITAKIIVKDLKPIRATATWPDQDVIDQRRVIPFRTELNVDLKATTIRDGIISFEIFSSLEDSIFLTYKIPNLTNIITGLPFTIDTVVAPAPPNGFSSLNKTYQMRGFRFDFNGEGYATTTTADDSINTYVTELTAKIQYTGIKKTLSLDDTVFVNAVIDELKPEIAYGFMKNQKVNVGPEVLNFDLFNRVKSGMIDLKDVNFEIEVDNGLGAPALARFNNLKAINSNGIELDLNFNNGNDTMEIAAAVENAPTLSFNSSVEHVVSTRTLNASNSNIDAFAEHFPNQIVYDVAVELNPNSPTYSTADIVNNPPNFVYYEDGIKAKMNIEVPLNFIADSLVLVDTVEFSLQTQSNNLIKSGSFKLIVDNGFPLDASTSIYFLDDNDVIIDSLWNDQLITRASVNASNRVKETTQTVINFDIGEEKMTRITGAAKAFIKAGFHTFSLSDAQKEFYKIYSDYGFDVKLIGDFNYKISN